MIELVAFIVWVSYAFVFTDVNFPGSPAIEEKIEEAKNVQSSIPAIQASLFPAFLIWRQYFDWLSSHRDLHVSLGGAKSRSPGFVGLVRWLLFLFFARSWHGGSEI